MTWLNYFLIAVLAFILEAIDASFGMGYGTILTPTMLMLGFDAMQVVPAIIKNKRIQLKIVWFNELFIPGMHALNNLLGSKTRRPYTG